MSSTSIRILLLLAVWLVVPAPWAGAQYSQIQLTTPLHGVQDSFYERIGIGWGFNVRGPRSQVFFDNGGANSALPPFGGFSPAADARLGVGLRGGNGNFGFNLAGSQGSSRSFIGQAATVVVPHGGTGFISDAQLRPFVTGIVPVVGGWQVSPLEERLGRLAEQPSPRSAAGQRAVEGGGVGEQRAAPATPLSEVASGGLDAGGSSASRGDLSVAEIRRQAAEHEAAGERQVQRLIERARGAEAAGKPGVAGIYYQQAANRASGPLKQQLQDKIRSLRDSQ